MGKAMLRAAVVMAALAAVSAPAMAVPTVDYEGAFDLPTGPTHYPLLMAFVPAKTPRPGNPNVSGPNWLNKPTLVVDYTFSTDAVRECDLSVVTPKIGGPYDVAPFISYASGGTEYSDAQGGPWHVDSAGNMWKASSSGTSGGTPGMFSDPAGTPDADGSDATPTEDFLLGNDAAGTIRRVETGWVGASFTVGGTLRRSDASDSPLPTDGTAIGATFIHSSRYNSSPYQARVYESVRTAAGAMSTTGSPLFTYDTADFSASGMKVEYAKDSAGAGHFLLFRPLLISSGVPVYFFEASTTGSNATPEDEIDIADMIVTAGTQRDASSWIWHIAVDWDNSTLYALESDNSGGLGRNARIHVFTLQGPVAAPIPEPAGLGLLGLALLGIRKRRK